jgi:hypothetical protein
MLLHRGSVVQHTFKPAAAIFTLISWRFLLAQ